ncbi:unnamed protein product [Gordionus sp. m RMFG-2023]|uniref:uncharacterized protein LOC135930576 n=1 Tax=Gordionus sp. m RMFG-2023 TaxID=3053472 RepID=UPI0030E5E123
MGFEVKLYVYELTKGVAQSMSSLLLGTAIDGVWHTSIVVYGHEYFYGKGGIQICNPGLSSIGPPDEIINLGITEVDKHLFREYLAALKTQNYKGDEYDLFHHNCNTFTDEVSRFLTGRSIPSRITEVPNQVLSSPFGPILQSYLENIDIECSPSPPPHSSQHFGYCVMSQTNNNTENGPTANANSLKEKPRKTLEDPPSIESFQDENKPDLFVGIEAAVLYEKLKEKLKDKISAAEFQLLNECNTYVITEDPLWCVNDNHAQFLCKILHDTTGTFDKQDKLLTLQMLQLLVLSFDFILVIKHECTHGLMSYIQQFDKLSKEEKISILMLLSNCCYTKTGFYYLTSMIEWPESKAVNYNNGTIVSKIVSECLISKQNFGGADASTNTGGDTLVFDLACNLIWHLAYHKVPEEMAMEISIALLQAIKTEKNEKSLFACLVALNNFMDITPEVQSLCKVMDMTMDEYKGVSTRVDKLCDEIKIKLDTPAPQPHAPSSRHREENVGNHTKYDS